MNETPAPAAQYLRMSTDHQQYSLDNQADAIARYAAEHGFAIVKTYSDAAKSGLRLKNRAGLKQLLKDVAEGQLAFRAILVYDVSRWGRFQDADEAAHYEYLCKSSGVPVHYCAEMFPNDNSMSGLILKAVKRTMAGEYSRELSVKVRAGLFRLATLGYKLGGSAVYGLRRQLLDRKGTPKQLLAYGEHKSITDERVILVPGPPEEIATVRRIFHEFADENRSPHSITARLNRDGIPYLRGAKWRACTVRNILQDPHYVGIQVWGRTTAFLKGPVKRLPSERWAICPKAFEPIISQGLFVRAQQTVASLTCRLSDEQILDRLRQVLKSHGRLTSKLIGHSRLCPAAGTFYLRFGGLLNVYAQLGYSRPEQAAAIASRTRTIVIRRELIKSLLGQFPNQLEEIHLSFRFRSRLRDPRSGLLIAVMIARYCPTKKGEVRWTLDCGGIREEDRNRVTVLALLDEKNTTVKELKVFPRVDFPGTRIYLRKENKWLQSGARLERIADFFDVLKLVRESSSS
jgi:DNA invertase Pin-like site-specific DNA recombinase